MSHPWIYDGYICTDCNSMIIVQPANNDHADYYYYCSNTGCRHHKGSEIYDTDKLEWAIPINEPKYANLLLTDQNYIKNLFTECSQIWGAEAQIGVMWGELGELIALIGKEKQNRCTEKDWIDEIADCIIMLNQFALIKNELAVKNRIIEKLIKVKDRLENSKLKIRELANIEIQKTIENNPQIYGKGN